MKSNLFTKKFFKLAVFIFSALILVYASQVGVLGNTQRGPQSVLAENPIDIPVVPPQPCEEDVQYCDGNTMVHKHGGYWDGNQCVYAFDNVGQCGVPTPQPQPCEEDVQYCDGNTMVHKHGGYWDGNQCVYAFDNVGQCGQPAPTPTPFVPQCPRDAVVGTRIDAQGCTRNIHTREDCSQYEGGAYNCPAVPTPQPPVPTQQPVQPVVVQCPIGTVRNSQGNCEAQQITQTQQTTQQCPNGTSLRMVGSAVVCVSVQQEQAQQVQQGVNVVAQGGNAVINGSGNSTNNNTNTQTQTNNPAPTVTNTVTREVTREVVRFAENSGPTFRCPAGTETRKEGNEIVCVQIVKTQVAGVQTEVKELPKTGLPLAAWAALAFVPAGLRLKRFAKSGVNTEESANYIWESREFKRN